jgi:hypothetical protein
MKAAPLISFLRRNVMRKKNASLLIGTDAPSCIATGIVADRA